MSNESPIQVNRRLCAENGVDTLPARFEAAWVNYRHALEYFMPRQSANRVCEVLFTPDQPCPKCGEEMEFFPTDSEGDDSIPNGTRTIPAHWGCECGHTEKHEEHDHA